MKKNIFFISLIALVVIIIAATLVYNKLSTKVETPSVIEEPVNMQSSEPESSSKEESQVKTSDSETKDAAEPKNDTESKAESSKSEDTGTSNQTASSQTTNADSKDTEEFPAPDFELLDSSGNTVNFSDYAGKPTVVNFWASWCGPCVVEMPYFQSSYEKHSEDVNFMMVNLTSARETMENATEFIDEHEFSFPVFYDFEQQAAAAYNISSIPLSVFVDSQGNIVTYARGSLKEEDLEKGINILFKNEENIAAN